MCFTKLVSSEKVNRAYLRKGNYYQQKQSIIKYLETPLSSLLKRYPQLAFLNNMKQFLPSIQIVYHL